MRFTVSWLAPLASFVVACAGAPSVPAMSPASAPLAATPVAAPDIELRDASGKGGKGDKGAVVRGAAVPMDGIAEGLAWPALRAAVPRKRGERGETAPITIAVGRSVPLATVLRAVWTLRDADLRLETPDESGTPRILELRPKPDAIATDAPCHLAIFAAPNGDLSVALPGGPRLVTGPAAADSVARALAAERARCPIRYVAFGAEDAGAPWSSVFDVARAIDRDKSAGDARYVLAEPVHLTTK
jgi:hypothetical protein